MVLMDRGTVSVAGADWDGIHSFTGTVNEFHRA